MKNRKKTVIITVLISISCLFLVTGCSIGGEKIICNNTDEELGVKENIEVVAVLKNDSISKISATFSFNSKNDMNTICSALKSSPSNELNFSCNGSSIKIKNFANMLDFNALNTNKAYFVEKMTQDGFTCR